jgi:hypothetical protein
MDEPAKERRGPGSRGLQQSIQGGVAQECAGGCREPRRDAGLQQRHPDPVDRQSDDASSRPGGAERFVLQSLAVIVRDLEIGEIRREPLDPNDRLARPQAKADCDPRLGLSQEIGHALTKAGAGHGQSAADHPRAGNGTPIKRVRNLTAGFKPRPP